VKLTAQEEYGLRCLLRIAGQWPEKSLTIPEVSRLEGISAAYAGKILQILRQGGFLKSVRGQVGGYSLAAPPEKLVVRDVLDLLGGRMYEEGFCRSHKGSGRSCTHSTDCSVRSLWRTIQSALDGVLGRTTLKDLLRKEAEMTFWLRELLPLDSRSTAPDQRA
jgi:Rrf2 family iron-sulfur cluster assembly transcriptional regulator